VTPRKTNSFTALAFQYLHLASPINISSAVRLKFREAILTH
jgi:hypothetical protein